MKANVRTLWAWLVMAGALPPCQADAGCFAEPLVAVEGGLSGEVVGQATLCHDNNRLRVSLVAEGLKPRDVYSTWWMYFDNVSRCLEAEECGLDDLLESREREVRHLPDGTTVEGDLPQGVIGRMDSALVRDSGALALSGVLRRFRFSAQSEIWLLLLSHGPADRSDATRLARQLLTPEMPVLGEPMMGIGAHGRRSQVAGFIALRYEDLLRRGGER